MCELNFTLLIKVIQGQDSSDIDLFSSVVMSNVCGFSLDAFLILVFRSGVWMAPMMYLNLLM